jgi:complex iron-sulfur molybdoenzyme family reductase subunit gamma
MRAPAVAALLLALAPDSRASEELLASETVAVKAVPAPVPADPAAAIWQETPGLAVVLAPQRSIRLHDRKANEALAAAGPRSATVRAVSDGKELAVLVEWADPAEDRAEDETDLFGDGAALELPLRYGAGLRLPYVGMGDDEMPVVLYFQRAGPKGSVPREAVAKGFGSTTRADVGGARMAMRYADGRWRAVFVRPIAAPAHALEGGLVPFAVALWEGARSERGGNKGLSAWKLLRLPGRPVDATYASELAWGRRPEDRGDLARGRQLVTSMCAACHLTGERRVARPGIAPDLSVVGAISTPAYLRDSIVAPSAVVVPSPNPEQHQDRTRPADANGAYPRSEAFVWSRRDAGGRLVSKMPAYASLPEADVKAMVSYLMTLGAPESGAGRMP